ncbi:hypothetical protein DNTS_014670 [Danionella cerebrum]|uniref:Uncharacterized protein n=1 Tax=Danionella cerebrum TaxID=2873325 RepID=A0A553Q1X9_9TELE|nr:hypothetical protein DNTS_014670 [Danionella translucida]
MGCARELWRSSREGGRVGKSSGLVEDTKITKFTILRQRGEQRTVKETSLEMFRYNMLNTG